MRDPHGMKILPHLFRVAWWDIESNDAINCDVFAVDCGASVVLIDAGRGGPSYPLMKANLVELGLWDRVKVCLLTHLHQDHVGGTAQLQSDGVQVWSGRGASAHSGGDLLRLDRVLEDGERFDVGGVQFEMLDTPGHTRACVSCFATVDGVRCAFTGDLVMPNGAIGYSGSPDFDAAQLLASIRRVAQRDFDALLTGHMLLASQPSGFWMKDGKRHVVETLQAGLDGKWGVPSA